MTDHQRKMSTSPLSTATPLSTSTPYTNPTPSISTTPSSTSTYTFPAHHSFPPFFTLQPIARTRASQLASWSSLITSYASTTRTFRLTPTHPLFSNATLRKSLSPPDAREVLSHMVASGLASWVVPSTAKHSSDEVWLWWRSAESWAGLLAAWAEARGQRNTVLTMWELLEGEENRDEEFHGLPGEMAVLAVQVLARRGKASLFGEGEGMGVKFYF